jgi:hypothetical protein
MGDRGHQRQGRLQDSCSDAAWEWIVAKENRSLEYVCKFGADNIFFTALSELQMQP